MTNSTTNLPTYSVLNLSQIHALAKSGVGALLITYGPKARAQDELIDEAQLRFRSRDITVIDYRKRLGMIVNHARRKLTQDFTSNQFKPQVQAFLRKCYEIED